MTEDEHISVDANAGTSADLLANEPAPVTFEDHPLKYLEDEALALWDDGKADVKEFLAWIAAKLK